MIPADRRGKIYKEAQRVHEKAEGYQLAHTVFACDHLIYEGVEELLRIPNSEKEALQLKKVKNRKIDIEDQINELDKKIADIKQKNPNHVYVRNFKSDNEGAKARVMCVADRYYEIAVPEHMWKKCLPNNDTGLYDGEAIRTLRITMAHEIGHILLHPTAIVIGGVEESENQKAEASIFSEKLIKLRNDRRKAQVDQGVYIMESDISS